MDERFKIDPCGVFNPCRQIAGWEETQREEAESRNDAMLGLPETICGLKIKPLTFRHLLWLDIYESPFLTNAPAELLARIPDIYLHVARFMWVLSPRWKPFGKIARWIYFRHYRKTLYGKKNNTLEIVAAICKFMADSTWELKDESRKPKSANYFSSAAAAVYFLCGKFHGLNPDPLAPNAAIDLPVKIYSQLLRVEIYATDPKAKIKLKNRADELEQNWLRELNEQLKRN